MKKSKVFVLSLMFALFGTVSSYASSPTTSPDEIRKEILSLVKGMDLTAMQGNSERVQIQFLVNNNNEIVVLNISESDFDSRLKDRLNNKKINSDGVVKNKIYSVPVVFQKK